MMHSAGAGLSAGVAEEGGEGRANFEFGESAEAKIGGGEGVDDEVAT